MSEWKSRLVVLAAAAALSGACGGADTGSSSDQAGGTPQADASAASSSGDACEAFAFTDTEPFSANDWLFVDFDQPAGWVHSPHSDGLPGHGTIHPADQPSRFGIEYLLMPVPMEPGMANQIRESNMQRWETIDYAGESIQVYENTFPDAGTITVGVNLPYGEAHYDLVFTVRGPRDCGLSHVDAARALAVRSLTPASETTFESR